MIKKTLTKNMLMTLMNYYCRNISKLNSFKHGQNLGEGAKIGTLAIQFTYVIDDEHQFDNNVFEF